MSTPPCLWSRYRTVPELERDEVHLARLQLDESSDLLSWLGAILAPEELERAARFRFNAERERYILTRGCLRVVVGRYLDVEPGALRFGEGRFGKPMLVNVSSDRLVEFSVSHSESIAALAFARGRSVGVDVERIVEDLPYHEMAARFFSAAELQSLDAQPADQQLRHFFRVWTRKEAYVKGRGQGLTISPERFSVKVTEDASRVEDSGCSSQPGVWRTVEFDVAAGYAGALAVEGESWTVRCFEALDAMAS